MRTRTGGVHEIAGCSTCAYHSRCLKRVMTRDSILACAACSVRLPCSGNYLPLYSGVCVCRGVCVCVCVCVCICSVADVRLNCAYVHVKCACTFVCMRACTRIHTCTHAHTHARTHARTLTRTHTNTHRHTHTDTYTHTHTHTHTCTYRECANTSKHTHAHTHAPGNEQAADLAARVEESLLSRNSPSINVDNARFLAVARQDAHVSLQVCVCVRARAHV